MKQITIFGVGLIGGSLAKALKKHDDCAHIIGCSRSEENLMRAKELGVIDAWSTDPISAVQGSDLIFISTPLGAMEQLLCQLKPALSDDVIITDGGSAKQSVIDAVERALGYLPPRFVPGHPIAGREKSGVEAAVDDLYVNRKVVLTPLAHTDKEATDQVTSMWHTTGASVECMPVDIHDKVLAATSHLPHILAFQLVNTLSDLSFSDDVFRYAAGGFQDFTRIASSDPVMWRDICIKNKSAILYMMDEFQKDMAQLRDMVEHSDDEAIHNLLSQAKLTRDDYLKRRLLEEIEP